MHRYLGAVEPHLISLEAVAVVVPENAHDTRHRPSVMNLKRRDVVADELDPLDRQQVELARHVPARDTGNLAAAGGVAGTDETTIAPGRAVANALRLEYHDMLAGPGKLQSC